MVVGALPAPIGGACGVGDQGTASKYWVGQSISAHINMLASTIALHTLVSLFLTFTEEKPKVKGIPKGIPTIKPKQTCSKWLLWCALKRKLYCVDCPRTMTQCMPLHAP